MAYCTSEDIELRIGRQDLTALSDYDADGAPDPTVVAGAIDSAQALIDSYLSVRFAVPVELASGGCPDALRARAVGLSVYFLRLGRDSVTDSVRAQYQDDVAWLRQVVAGTVSLGVEPRPAASVGSPRVNCESTPRLFGRGEPL